MVRERGQKKSFQQSLDDIKEKMIEKKNKRLASASAANRGRSKRISKTSVGNVKPLILKNVQINNKALALALQAEKEKVRQANDIILQMKREQQALFLLLKRRLKDQDAQASNVQTGPAQLPAEPPKPVDSSRRIQSLEVLVMVEAPPSPISSDSQFPEGAGQSESDGQVALPRTVSVRCRRLEGSRRRSERVREWCPSSQNPCAPTEPLIPEETEVLVESPVLNDRRGQNHIQEVKTKKDNPIGSEEFQQHSTPGPPAKPANQQQQPRAKPKQSQPLQPKPELERGRKHDRPPLKKPWETSKPRARSKSRDHSATRTRAGAGTTAPLNTSLNTSQGFNDTFDFECEDGVHLTPFKGGGDKDNPPATPIQEEEAERGQGQTLKRTRSSPESSSSSESEHSPYIPQKRKRRCPPDQAKPTLARRGRGQPSKAATDKESAPPLKRESLHGRRVEACPTAGPAEVPETELQLPEIPGSVFVDGPGPMAEQGLEGHTGHHRVDGEEALLPVTPGVEEEMMRIDNVLPGFRDSPCEPPGAGLPTSSTPQNHAALIPKTCRRTGGLGVRARWGFSLIDVTNITPAAYQKFSLKSPRPSDRCSIPARKRRSTITVDYKEPSLHVKLRRGDKFTDTKFLRSPIFKQKPRKSMKTQPSLEGCRFCGMSLTCALCPHIEHTFYPFKLV
uniref:Shugoshin C-terminal domain-containing protein n=1 Tax=Hucho hucho TaxID=62062 RepID=A0A4W5KCE1_9TELE